MSWYKKAIDEVNSYLDSIVGYWILPSGQFVNIEFGGHEEYARKNLLQFGITEENMREAVRSGEYKDAYEMAFARGGIRLDIVVKTGEASICGTKQAIRKNVLQIQDVLIKNNIHRIIVEIFDINALSAYTPNMYRSKEDFVRDFF